MEIVRYERAHLETLLALAEGAEFSSSFIADPERAHRALSAPGAVALVALGAGEPVGFSHAITDGAFQAYLALLFVAPGARGRGVGRALVDETIGRCGAIRLDLISTEEAEPFYRGFHHGGRWPGYRLYPNGAPGARADDE
jgi:GNAT superfamily N-acetyltransferase